METFAKSISIIKQSGDSGPSNSLRINISTSKLVDRLLFLIKPIAEYALGIHIGFAFGWLIGLFASHFFVNQFEPSYLDDLSQLSFWRQAPGMFAKHGALAGVGIGVSAITIINGILLNQRIKALFEKNITNPDQIARLLDKSTGKIKRTINKLTHKGKISRK